MAGREKPKRKALHRGLDDIINRDASLTSRLLGRVKPPSREPLPSPTDEKGNKPEPESEENSQPCVVTTGEGSEQSPANLSVVSTHEDARRPTLLKRDSRIHSPTAEHSKHPPPRAARSTNARQTQKLTSDVVLAEPASITSFEAFAERWGFILKSGGRIGKLRICEVLYNNTYAVGRETFFTSYEKLAKLTNLERKQCSINVKQLESLGFVERVNIFNTATRQGTEFKLHLRQVPPNERRAPRYHCYDEDLE